MTKCAENLAECVDKILMWSIFTHTHPFVFLIAEGLHPSAHCRQVRQHQGGTPAAAEGRQPGRAGQERPDPAARGHPLQPRQRCPATAGEQGQPPCLSKGERAAHIGLDTKGVGVKHAGEGLG